MTYPTWTCNGYTGPLIASGVALALAHPFGGTYPAQVTVAGKTMKVVSARVLAKYDADTAYALTLDGPTPFVPLLPASMWWTPAHPERAVNATWQRPDGTTRGGFLLRPGATTEIPVLMNGDRNYASGSAWYATVNGTAYVVGVTKSANTLVCPEMPQVVSAAQAFTADFDGNGRVDFADLSILAANYGKAGGHAQGDADGDGRVGFSDLLAVGRESGK